mmetsp:Transcript_110020/g.173823  ORF Transcript_110020/g.173823 Transcript_110020/m.173823 type:complete len:253 (+) Transcript_110020:23-781(+)
MSSFLGTPITFGPEDCDAAVIFLHGHDESPEQRWPDKLWPLREAHPTWRWVHLRAPSLPQTCWNEKSTFAWGDYLENKCTVVGSIDYDNPDSQGWYAASVSGVHACIESLQASGVPPSRIVVFGFSQGAAVALDAALKFSSKASQEHDACLAGCIGLSGWILPSGRAALEVIRKEGRPAPAFLLLHGTADDWVEFKCSEDANVRLKEAGLTVAFEHFEDWKHGHAWPLAIYREALEGFFLQVFATPGESVTK